jgi:hypothetical protein
MTENNLPKRPGISEGRLLGAGIRFSDFPEPGSIEIPYRDPDGNYIGFSRWRLAKEGPNGKKYHQKSGTGVHVYYPPNWLQPGDSLLITEGEFKALSLMGYGYSVIGLPSFICYKKDESGERQLLPGIRTALDQTRAKDVFFIGDSDTASNIEFSRSAHFLASALKPILVRLPHLALEGPKGVDDLKEKLGAIEFKAALARCLAEATLIDPEASFVYLAGVLLEAAAAQIKNLPEVRKSVQHGRVIRMCAAAELSEGKIHELARLFELALSITSLGKRALKAAIECEIKELKARAYQQRSAARAKPEVLAPNLERPESEVASEIGTIMAKTGSWFLRNDAVVVVGEVASGFEFAAEPNRKFKVVSTTTGFKPLSGIEAKFRLEDFITPTVMARPEPGAPLIRVAKSFTTDFCCGLMHSPQLKVKLPLVTKILTSPIPLRREGKELIYPKRGYDERFGTYLVQSAPAILTLGLEEALRNLANLMRDFCFRDEQSRTHAYARLFTPFGRGLLGWTTRTPLWAFLANRPRAGKDYLAISTIIIYEGHACEDQPIDRNSEETAKRLVAAANAGRRFMHFSNCQAYLCDPFLAQALTGSIRARLLGTNSASSDLELPNEIEFSLSGNIGLTWREDIGYRMREIHLAFFQEDPNSRTFSDPFLHHSIAANRDWYLSSIAACYQHWSELGAPKGKTPFTSFPGWAELVGGVLSSCGLGDPCLPQSNPSKFGGDCKTEAMRALFELCYRDYPEELISKTDIYGLIDVNSDSRLEWFQPSKDESPKALQTRLGKALHAFENRELSGVKLLIDSSNSKSQRDQFKFAKALPPT